MKFRRFKIKKNSHYLVDYKHPMYPDCHGQYIFKVTSLENLGWNHQFVKVKIIKSIEGNESIIGNTFICDKRYFVKEVLDK